MASSRSACSMGERPNVAPAAARQSSRARSTAACWASDNRAAPSARDAASTSDNRELEPLGAPRDRRGGVVQLVREPRRQLAEGGHLLFLKVARREMAGAVEHDVHEDRGELVAVANQRRDLLAGDHQDLGRLLGLHVARRRDEARVRQEPAHVAPAPLHDLVRPGAPVDVNRQVAGKDDVQTEHRSGPSARARLPSPIGRGWPRAASQASWSGRRAGEQPVRSQTILNRSFQLRRPEGHVIHRLFHSS